MRLLKVASDITTAPVPWSTTTPTEAAATETATAKAIAAAETATAEAIAPTKAAPTKAITTAGMVGPGEAAEAVIAAAARRRFPVTPRRRTGRTRPAV